MMRTITLEVPRKLESNETIAPNTKQITVLVTADLKVTIDTGERKIEDLPLVDVTKTLQPLLADLKTDRIVFVDFEGAVPWGAVVSTMDSVRRVAADQLRSQDPNSGNDPIDIKVALKMKDDKDKAGAEGGADTQ